MGTTLLPRIHGIQIAKLLLADTFHNYHTKANLTQIPPGFGSCVKKMIKIEQIQATVADLITNLSICSISP